MLVNLDHGSRRLPFGWLLSDGLVLVRIERLAKRRVADYPGATEGREQLLLHQLNATDQLWVGALRVGLGGFDRAVEIVKRRQQLRASRATPRCSA